MSAQVANSALVIAFAFLERAGLPSGQDLLDEELLGAHPEYRWQRPVLRNMKGNPWAVFKLQLRTESLSGAWSEIGAELYDRFSRGLKSHRRKCEVLPPHGQLR